MPVEKWRTYVMQPKTVTAICATCGKPFEKQDNSRARYCQEHYGGRKIEVASDMKTVEKLAQELFHERAQDFVNQHVPIGPVPEYLKAMRVEDMGFDTPQSGVAPFHDLHWGSYIDARTTSGMAYYDNDVALTRLTRWRDLVLRFTQMQQVLMPVTELHLLALGDDFEGHGDMFGTQKLGLVESIGFEYLSFVDHVSNILLDLLQRYEHITVYKVHGNHGRITARAKDAYPPDNLELFAWQNIADRVRIQTGGEWEGGGASSMSKSGVRALKGGMIDFYIASSPAMLLEIEGWKFVIMHGHGLKGLASTYTGAIDTKLRWNSLVGETINYLVKAHLHQAESAEHEIGGEIMQGGCFVGPSPLSLSMARPAANLPSQELFFMHPKHGKTFHHRLRLETIESMRQYVEWIGR